MKNIIYIILAVLVFSACKKDGIIVNKNKNYSNAAIGLVLTPAGNGSMFLGSNDAGMPITYKINGKTLKVYRTQFDDVYKFKIISENELKYKGESLYLYDEGN